MKRPENRTLSIRPSGPVRQILRALNPGKQRGIQTYEIERALVQTHRERFPKLAAQWDNLHDARRIRREAWRTLATVSTAALLVWMLRHHAPGHHATLLAALPIIPLPPALERFYAAAWRCRYALTAAAVIGWIIVLCM